MYILTSILKVQKYFSSKLKMDISGTVTDEGASKKGRHRKKQLYNSILHLMEFYFSDSNLAKDRFLSKLILEDPYVDLSVFLTFNKIRKLGASMDDLKKALSKSSIIELSEDKTKVKRKIPLKIKENVEDCTIYVENINSDATHDSLKLLFSEFGNVVYVSIPKYKYNKAIKGFCFIEFETEEEAQRALEYFKSIDCCLSCDIDPGELKSIATFEDTENKMDIEIKEENPKKRKLSDNLEENPEKKIKSEDSPQKVVEFDTENKKKKKQKKDKKKNYIKELGFRVLSKKDWRRMRNKYLNLQRTKMGGFKRSLKLEKQSSIKENSEENKANIKMEIKCESTKIEYTPGRIVKIKLPEPCLEVKKFKFELRNNPDILYIDIPASAGFEEVYVRFSDENAAKKFLKHEIAGEKMLLEGAEEESYWQKIKDDRNNKLSKECKKVRGRDKLLKKAQKQMARHIRFSETE